MKALNRLTRKVKSLVVKTIVRKTLGSIPSVPNSIVNKIRDYLLRKPKKETPPNG